MKAEIALSNHKSMRLAIYSSKCSNTWVIWELIIRRKRQRRLSSLRIHSSQKLITLRGYWHKIATPNTSWQNQVIRRSWRKLKLSIWRINWLSSHSSQKSIKTIVTSMVHHQPTKNESLSSTNVKKLRTKWKSAISSQPSYRNPIVANQSRKELRIKSTACNASMNYKTWSDVRWMRN